MHDPGVSGSRPAKNGKTFLAHQALTINYPLWWTDGLQLQGYTQPRYPTVAPSTIRGSEAGIPDYFTLPWTPGLAKLKNEFTV